MAAYAARGGLEAYIFMPKDTPLANIEESRIAGATVILINGLISEAAGMAGEKARLRAGLMFPLSRNLTGLKAKKLWAMNWQKHLVGNCLM
jgi:threonine synthase